MASYNFKYYLKAVLKRPRHHRHLEQLCFTSTNNTYSDRVCCCHIAWSCSCSVKCSGVNSRCSVGHAVLSMNSTRSPDCIVSYARELACQTFVHSDSLFCESLQRILLINSKSMYCAGTCQTTTLEACFFAALCWFCSVYLSAQVCKGLAEQAGIKVMLGC